MTTTTVLCELFRFLGLASMVVVLFLLFAIIAIAIRPLMIIVAVVGLVPYCFSPRFREWVKVAGTELFS